MILSNDILKQYNRSRAGTDKSLPCHAPTLNMNFEQNGNVRACCYNAHHILGKWPEQSILEIWQGASANELREYIRKNDFGGGCEICGKMIEAGNYQGVRARYYDEFAVTPFNSPVQFLKGKLNPGAQFPKVMEFELSNQCNLECVMCNGYFSSSIRKNREKLPAIHSPYNEEFVNQLEPFIPHLTDAKFLGGEPFMIDIYLLIWERMLKINPNIRIHITTNGTFLNNRIKALLEGLRAGIILSMDSIEKETYQQIRVNGNYEKVMENLEYFVDYTRRKKTFISMAACPIIYNWKELPKMLDFCIEKNIALFFNAVFYPVELSLREQPVELLKEIIAYLQQYCKKENNFGNSQGPYNLTVRAYNDFIKLLQGWLQERELVQAQEDILLKTSAEAQAVLEETAGVWSLQRISNVLSLLADPNQRDFETVQKRLQIKLGQLLALTPSGQLGKALFCYVSFSGNGKSEDHAALEQKFEAIAGLIEPHPQRNEILMQMGTADPLQFAALIANSDLAALKEEMSRHF